MNESIKERFKELLLSNPPLAEIERMFNEAVDSGIIQSDGSAEYTYDTAKILAYAIFSKLAERWKPYEKEAKKEAGTIQQFIQ